LDLRFIETHLEYFEFCFNLTQSCHVAKIVCKSHVAIGHGFLRKIAHKDTVGLEYFSIVSGFNAGNDTKQCGFSYAVKSHQCGFLTFAQ
jgi:hypothetical protein